MRYLLLILCAFTCHATSMNTTTQDNWNQLTPEESRIIVNKGTERPFTGKYENFKDVGIFTCRRCEAALYHSRNKFNSGCGWPAFDDAITGAVRRLPDADGRRTEILCAHCGGHLGHVFEGERLTPKNTRHCVNSLSMGFVPVADIPQNFRTLTVAGGCFWGVEYYLQQLPGVISATSGYVGSHTPKPSYQEVCAGKTGHYEAVQVLFDPRQIGDEALLRRFFEIHDPTQADGQGPDLGPQYRSAIFYADDAQRSTAERLMAQLRSRGYKLATSLHAATSFYPAEDYHQDYYAKKGTLPYCHTPVKRFGD